MVTKKSGFLKRLQGVCVSLLRFVEVNTPERASKETVSNKVKAGPVRDTGVIRSIEADEIQYGLEMRGQVTGSVDIKVE